MKHSLLLATSICLLSTLGVYSQVEWAYSVEEFSSERGSKKHSSVQVLGEPNMFPNRGDSPVSWSPSKPNNKKEEFIKVTFKKKDFIQQIVVAESFNPGTISKIYFYNTNDREFLVYDKEKLKRNASSSKLFSLTFPSPTLYKVRAAKIVLSTHVVDGYNSIDAIGVTKTDEPVDVKVELIKDGVFTASRENLGPSINTRNHDYIPQISPDGKTLFFTRTGMAHEEADEESTRIFYSEYLESNKWSIAKEMDEPLNNENPNFVYTITPDGNTLLLGNSYGVTGSGLGASISLRTNKGWSNPKPAIIKGLISESHYNEFFLAANKRVMLMTLQNDQSFGETDVFVSFRLKDNTWSEPKNLGKNINTADIEASPFLAADNRTIYFASRGHRGYGKEDLFRSERIGQGWDNWTKPQNLGPVINSKESEFYYSIPASGEYAYFVSDANSLGASDIFRIKLPNAIKPKPVALVYGKVYNAKTKKPIESDIFYELLPQGIASGMASSDPYNGRYKIALPVGQKYGFFASKKGLVTISDDIDLTKVTEYEEIRRDLYLVPLEKGMVFNLNNVIFERSKFDLKPTSTTELKRVVDLMNLYPGMTIKLKGHTEKRGVEQLNMDLSENRVKEVKKFLVDMGIGSRRIQIEGYGSKEPLNKELTENEKRLDRRVEVQVLTVEEE